MEGGGDCWFMRTYHESYRVHRTIVPWSGLKPLDTGTGTGTGTVSVAESSVAATVRHNHIHSVRMAVKKNTKERSNSSFRRRRSLLLARLGARV